MIILTTSELAQKLSVIPREYTAIFSMNITDDSTNVTKIYNITNAVTSGNYLTFENIFNPKLVEAHYFNLSLFADYNFWNSNFNFWQLDNNKWNETEREIAEIYNDKIFCTDQDIDQLDFNDHYQLNKGQFTEYDGFDNTYTVP
mgnify:CR=1 FL=1|tara:strand:- start:326 stop:757 length:432 start_codon:yes stop_codon:yes gene_type:complete